MSEKIIKRFWSKVDRSDQHGCWIWTASKNAAGYGTMHFGGKSTTLAHRIAFELHSGEPIEKGQSICHRCDVPACVNPAHLFKGSHKENMLDRDLKGRQPKGETNGQSRLTAKEVLEIRAIGRAKPQTEIAAVYGITRATVGDIIFGRRWAHVGGPLVSKESEHANKRSCERHAMAKRTADEVREIRDMAKTLPYREIARRTGINRKSISTIARGLSWANLEG